MTVKDRYLQWRRGSAVGCNFARLMAVAHTEYGQRVEVVAGSSAQTLAGTIDSLVTTHVADHDVEALTILLPETDGLQLLVGIALALAQMPGWTVTPWHEPTAPCGAVVAFGVARGIALANGTIVPSEVLVLGPYDVFPATRRAPVTALEIFVGTPLPSDPKKRTPTTKANLAHVNVSPPLSQKQFSNVWNASIAARLQSLGGIDDCRAKAKVAFVVPLSLATSMGCAP